MRPGARVSAHESPRGARRGAVAAGLAAVFAATRAAPSPGPANGGEPGASAARPPQELVVGVPAALRFRGGEPVVRSIVVPEGVTGLVLRTQGSDGDVELYASRGAPPDPFAGEWDVAAPNVWLEETLLIEVSDAVPLEAGRWFVAVVPLDESTTRSTLSAEFVLPAELEATAGLERAFTLERRHGLRARVEVDLGFAPDLARKAPSRWLVEVECPVADVDVDATGAGFLGTLERTYATGRSLFGYERFLIDVPAFRRKVVLDVFAYQATEHADELPVRVLVQRSEPPEHVPARDLCPPPRLPDPALPLAAAPLDAAARATVLVAGPYGSGSGVVVHPDGYVLSCAHVLVGAERPRSDDSGLPAVCVGFTLDPALPPVPAFSAELVEVRQDLDLALVRITGDLLGRSLERTPLGASPRFPTIAPAARAPLMGERVFGFGYPVTGGSTSMVSLTLTSGVCAGRSREVEGVLLKTDAEVHSGDSGGPFVDAEGRFVGLAVSSLADHDKGGGIGYVLPRALVPAAWLERLGW